MKQQDKKPIHIADLGGKIPPQAIEMEEAVLGAIMLDKNASNVVMDILKPEHFYRDSHGLIFAAIGRLVEKAEPTDILTVTNQLRTDGNLDICGGAYYITQLTNRIASAANIEFHARVVEQKFIQRELIRICGEGLRESYEETASVYDILENLMSQMSVLAEGGATAPTTFKEKVKETVSSIEKTASSGGVAGVPSGLSNLDNLTHGFQPTDLITIAARPGMGKTALVLAVIKNVAQTGSPVALFSLEMGSVQLIKRMLASESRINADKLNSGQIHQDEWVMINRAVGELIDLPIHLDDTPYMSVASLRAKARILKRKQGIELLVVDYLQLMKGGNDKVTREQEISYISRSLKALAKELNIPVIALSQLSRAVETRGGSKRPMLSDLRESGSIEQDSDVVAFIYRPEYYGIDQDESGNSTEGLTEIIIAKHRNGALDTVQLHFNAKIQTFTNMAYSVHFDEPQEKGEPF